MKAHLRKAFDEIALTELVVAGICMVIAIIVLNEPDGAGLSSSEKSLIVLGLTSLLMVFANLLFVLPLSLFVLRSTEE